MATEVHEAPSTRVGEQSELHDAGMSAPITIRGVPSAIRDEFTAGAVRNDRSLLGCQSSGAGMHSSWAKKNGWVRSTAPMSGSEGPVPERARR